MIAGTWLVSSEYWPFSSKDSDQFAKCRSSAITGVIGTIGGPFTLIDHKGATVTDADVITEPSLIYFGYTFCPDVCPLDTARNGEVVDILAQIGKSATPIFISIDPKRDTSEVMAEYSEWIHPKMKGLTGSQEQVKAASKAYRTYYKLHPDEGNGFYLVDHSTMTYLVLPEHGFMEFFRRDQSAEKVAEKVACYINSS
ncbi:MAG: SCO family protein [Paracoccaceae bacterium]|nr:SCO family protein [Paracoccaceae bacterium]